MNQGFLPVCRKDMEERGWDAVDFAYVIGDAYVDHPSFGPAIISRILEANGYRVGIISQPDWKDNTSIMEYGEPKLGFLVSGGNMDSMVNHYSCLLYTSQIEVQAPYMGSGAPVSNYSFVPITVEAGGATIFVINVEEFHKV